MKWYCTVCGYVYEGDAAPAECPVCHVGADKFKEVSGEKTWAAEHVVGVVCQGMTRTAVPCFVMLSGAFLLSDERWRDYKFAVKKNV